MKPRLILFAAVPLIAQMMTQTLLAQTPPAAPAAAAPVAAPAAPAPGASSVPASSVPASEQWVSGSVEAGYRWNTGPSGSLDTYRSVVNLGSGPKLIGADVTITDPRHWLFDSIHVRASDWADPYSTLNAFGEKEHVYHFTASYRSLAYFNNLPSFADPLLQQGIQLNEQSFDARRHLGAFELHLLPNRRVSPYVAFDHDGNNGHGVTTFQTNDNEFAVPYTNQDITNQYRGGVNITLQRLHLTLEEGGTTWKSNENTYSGASPGNSTSLVLGQALTLGSLAQEWGIRGSGAYSRVILTASPFSWAEVYGHFGYADPHNTVNYTQTDKGNLILLSQVLFYTGEQYLLTAAARAPHTSGDIGWQIRPHRRVRVDQHWLTDRMHSAGSSNGTDALQAAGSTGQTVLPSSLSSFLASNYSELETGVGVDVTPTVRLRAAYRYVWGDANDIVLPQAGLLTVQRTRLQRNVVFGSASWRLVSKVLVAADVEWAKSGSEYFRTSLYDYRKARFTARYDVSPRLRFSADYRVMSNSNPLAGNPYKSLSHQESFAVQWTPPVKNSMFDAVYEHCGYQTQMSYLDPTYLMTSVSMYRENCHDVNATLGFVLKNVHQAKVSAGGSALLTSGSRPTTYYQPIVRVSVPVTKTVGWFAAWQYYGFGENFYGYENFQTNLFTTGLRYSR